jgi:hypothetical protein
MPADRVAGSSDCRDGALTLIVDGALVTVEGGQAGADRPVLYLRSALMACVATTSPAIAEFAGQGFRDYPL